MDNIIGVEILSMKQIAVDYLFNWAGFWIAFGIAFVICMIVFTGCDRLYIMGPIISLIIGALFGVFIGVMTGIPCEYINQYKVTISDDVSMNEFNDKYKIIDQEGKIFIVEERKQQE